MKKVLTIILLALMLGGCALPGSGSSSDTESDAGEPTLTDNQMSTRVAQILTTMPTATTDPNAQPDAPALPTVIPTEPGAEAPEAPTQAVLPTNTSEPTAEPSEAPAESAGETATQTPTVTQTPTQIPTGGATLAAGDPLATLGEAAWSDDINDGTYWPIDEDSYSIGKVESGHLVMTGKQRLNAWRLAFADPLTNAYIETSIKSDSCASNDSYGVMFRVPLIGEADRGYLFGITCAGNYFLWEWDGKVPPDGKLTKLIDYTASDAIITGANQINRVGVMTIGSQFYLYVNGQMIHQVSDTTFPSGYIGIFVKPSSTLPYTVRVDKISYWKNPAPPQ